MRKFLSTLVLVLALSGCASYPYVSRVSPSPGMRHACFTEYMLMGTAIYPHKVCGWYDSIEYPYIRGYYLDQQLRARQYYQIRRYEQSNRNAPVVRAKEPRSSRLPVQPVPPRKAKRRGGG